MRTIQALLLSVSGLYLLSIAGLIWHSRSYGTQADTALRAKILEPYKRTPYGLLDKQTGDVYPADHAEQAVQRAVRRVATVRTWLYFGAGVAATVLYGVCCLTLAVVYRLIAGRKPQAAKPSPAIWNLRSQFSLGALLVVTGFLPPILYYLFKILSSISYITQF